MARSKSLTKEFFSKRPKSRQKLTLLLDRQRDARAKMWDRISVLMKQLEGWAERHRKLKATIKEGKLELRRQHVLELKKRTDSIKQERAIKKKNVAEIFALRQQIADMRKQEGFFTHGLSWIKSEGTKVELMLRAVTTYQGLVDKGTVTYLEIIYLSVGYEKEFFTRKDIEHRFGTDVTRLWARTMGKFMRAEYVKKVNRKPYFYLTVTGRNRLEDILKFMFTQKHKNYFTSYNDQLK